MQQTIPTVTLCMALKSTEVLYFGVSQWSAQNLRNMHTMEILTPSK